MNLAQYRRELCAAHEEFQSATRKAAEVLAKRVNAAEIAFTEDPDTAKPRTRDDDDY